jgi:quinol monooxygenase YgiN
MRLGRREFIGAAAVSLLAGCTGRLEGLGVMEEAYGLIGQIMAVPGKRAELIGYLTEGSGELPGNLAYIVAEDLEDPDSIWITEVWRTKADHENSLSLPGVEAAIVKARPIIAGFGTRAETRPVSRLG